MCMGNPVVGVYKCSWKQNLKTAYQKILGYIANWFTFGILLAENLRCLRFVWFNHNNLFSIQFVI